MTKKKLTPEILDKLYKRMVIQAQRKFDPAPEDVAQEYVVRLLEGLHQKATVLQAYIDIKRTQVNTRSKYAEAIKALAQGSTNSEALEYLAEPQELSLDQRIDLDRALEKIKDRRTRWIFTQVRIGKTLKEIAKDLDLTESRVNQIVNRQIVALRDQISS